MQQSPMRNVGKRPWLQSVILSFLFGIAVAAIAEDNQKQKLDIQYQSAVANYEAGRFAEAANQLEGLLPFASKSYEIHELLGMVYVSLSQNEKAVDQLKTAVQLKPTSAEARTNLGACLLHSGKTDLAGVQFRKALELDPKSYDANHNLGEFYVQSGRVDVARPLLERAHQIDSSAYDNAYDLAMADFLLGKLDDARQLVQSLVKTKDAGELHSLLGQIDEKDGKFVAAANDFEIAAHMDPSEDNLFDWGCELLLHRTYEPAIAVFEQGTQRFPNSPRLWIGLGLSLYSRGKYDDSVKALLAAADLNPSDPRSYLFLSKAYDSSPNQAEDVIQRFRRYAELEPGRALAQYYFAMSLWKGKRAEDAGLDLQSVQSLLQKAISIDPSLPEAHVQLGNLYADQHQYEKSIPEYTRALDLNPNLADAHYRLGTDLVHVGQKDRAQKEFEIYQKLRAEHLAEVDKERAEVKQFVYSEKAGSTAKQ
jgi:Tfp pilus assembly protein PilF